MTEEKRKTTIGELRVLEVVREELARLGRIPRKEPREVCLMKYGCPFPPAHVDPSPTLPPPSHDGQADELGPVAELRPDGQGGRAPELPRVNLDVLRAACGVQGWKISAADDGSWFVMTSEQASVRYESPRLPQMTARGPFDEVLDMIAVVAAAAIGKP